MEGSFHILCPQNLWIFRPPPPCPHLYLIYAIKFMQSPSLCPLFHDIPLPFDADSISGNSPTIIGRTSPARRLRKMRRRGRSALMRGARPTGVVALLCSSFIVRKTAFEGNAGRAESPSRASEAERPLLRLPPSQKCPRVLQPFFFRPTEHEAKTVWNDSFSLRFFKIHFSNSLKK